MRDTSLTRENSDRDQRSNSLIAAKTVALLALIFLFSCVARFGFGPLMPAIEQGLGISHSAAGMVFFWISFGYCIGIITSVRVSSYFNHRWTVILSALATVVALLAAACSTGAWTLSATLTMVGITCGWYLPSGLATITDTVARTNWGKAFAVHELAPNIGLIFSPFLIELCLVWNNWRWVTVVFSGAVLVGGISFFISGLGSRQHSAPISRKSLQDAFTNISVWSLLLIFTLAICANIGVYMMLPLYLVSEIGLERDWANTLVGISRGSGLLVIMFAGIIADRIKPQKAMALILGLGGVLILLIGWLRGSPLIVVILLQPIFSASFFPAGFIALMRVHPLAVNFCPPLAFLLGAGAIPAIMGVMADDGKFPEAMMLTGGLIILGAIVLPPFVHFGDRDENEEIQE